MSVSSLYSIRLSLVAIQLLRAGPYSIFPLTNPATKSSELGNEWLEQHAGHDVQVKMLLSAILS